MTDRYIAQRALELGAITLSTKVPYTWSKGDRMPIYNDNRLLLRDPAVRRHIGEQMRQRAGDYDFIIGTPTAGFAPATELALASGKPLVLLDGDKAYVHTFLDFNANGPTDVIAASNPWAIPDALRLANDRDTPLIYVREKQKQHGKGNKVEGLYHNNETVFIVDVFHGKSAFDHAKTVLMEEGLRPLGSATYQAQLEPLAGGRAVLVEDLVSTGGSSKKPLEQARECGFQVDHMLSIFNYGLGVAEEALGELEPKVELVSLLDYDTLMEVVESADSDAQFSEEQMGMLREWRADPFGWGPKHGFPNMQKKKQ